MNWFNKISAHKTFSKMDHFIDTKIPKLGIFVDKNSQNDQTPFPKVGRKTPDHT